jgi:hypothetical protein
MILAQHIMDLFESAAATARERRNALDIASTLVLDSILYPAERAITKRDEHGG